MLQSSLGKIRLQHQEFIQSFENECDLISYPQFYMTVNVWYVWVKCRWRLQNLNVCAGKSKRSRLGRDTLLTEFRQSVWHIAVMDDECERIETADAPSDQNSSKKNRKRMSISTTQIFETNVNIRNKKKLKWISTSATQIFEADVNIHNNKRNRKNILNKYQHL